MGNFSSSTCTVTIPLPLLREPHTIHNTTFSQRTEAGSGGISWVFPLVEGGETLPSSCSPLLATFDIATWLEQGQERQGGCHCELRPLRCSQLRECIHVIASARGQRSPAARGHECVLTILVHRLGLDLYSGPPHCLWVCLVAQLLP